MKDSGNELEPDTISTEAPSVKNPDGVENAGANKLSRFLTKRTLAIGAIGALIFLGIYGIYDISTTRNASTNKEQTCSEVFIKRASEALQVNDRKALNQYRAEILKDERNLSSQNCLLLLIKDRIMVGDTESAKKYLALLKKIYKPEVGYSNNFSGQTYSPEELEAMVRSTDSYEEYIQKQLRENSKISQQLDMEADKNAPKQQ